jgi:hypothetical protein
MAENERETSSVQAPQSSTGTSEPVTTVIVPAGTPADLLPIAPAPLLVDAEMLLTGLRQLKDRIPDYVHLTPREARGMGRAANLDPEFVSASLHAVSSAPDAKTLFGWSAEELRQLDEDSRRWDDVERELRIVLKGISDANRKRKNTLGSALLIVYAIVRRIVKNPGMEWLRPYYDEMRAASKRRRQRARPENDEGPAGDSQP